MDKRTAAAEGRDEPRISRFERKSANTDAPMASAPPRRRFGARGVVVVRDGGVAEAARLGPRREFRGHEKDFHASEGEVWARPSRLSNGTKATSRSVAWANTLAISPWTSMRLRRAEEQDCERQCGGLNSRQPGQPAHGVLGNDGGVGAVHGARV